jgi:glutamyl-tRNA reductase
VKRVQRARRGRSLFFIDIAVPRDVEGSVNDVDNVFLYDVDDLSQIVSESLHGRSAEAQAAESIVHAELESYLLRGRERALATPVVVGLRSTVRGTLLAELDKSLAHKLRHLGEAERDALVAMVEAATNKLLHGPTTRLKELAVDARGPEVLELVRDVFGLDEQPARASGEAQRAERAESEPAEPPELRRGAGASSRA